MISNAIFVNQIGVTRLLYNHFLHFKRAILAMKWSFALLCLLGLSGCAGHSSYMDASRMSAGTEPEVSQSELGKYLSTAAVRQRLLQYHQVWQGVPYRLGGNDKSGVDCSSFTQQAFRQQFGVALPRTTHAQATVGKPLDGESWQPGDLLFYRSAAKTRHVGIYLGQGDFLHASTSRGVMISRVDNPYWRRHFWQARRLP